MRVEDPPESQDAQPSASVVSIDLLHSTHPIRLQRALYPTAGEAYFWAAEDADQV